MVLHLQILKLKMLVFASCLFQSVLEIKFLNSCPSNLYSEDEDPEYKPLRMPFKDDMDDFTNSPLDDKDDTAEGEAEGKR